MCIDIMKIWFGIANGQTLLIFDRVICPQHDNDRVLSFNVFILRRNNKDIFLYVLLFGSVIALFMHPFH